MTRTGPSKKVDSAYVSGRLDNARSYLQSARDAFALAHEGSNTNPVMSQIVNAAIACIDALTGRPHIAGQSTGSPRRIQVAAGSIQ